MQITPFFLEKFGLASKSIGLSINTSTSSVVFDIYIIFANVKLANPYATAVKWGPWLPWFGKRP